MTIHSRIEGHIALIELENPPVNALSLAFVAQLRAEIIKLEQDTNIKAVILTGRGRFFSAGADIGEFDQDPVAVINALQGLNQQLNQCQKLVVMALHGAALGGGLELALSANARIAAPDTKIGLPEIHLGILPGAGGTQALPRLIGIQYAWPMMMQGVPISPERALQIGLIDKISDEDLVGDAIGLAQDFLAQESLPLKPYERRISEEQQGLADFFRQTLPPIEGAKFASAQAILDCLEMAVEKPFSEGLKFEAEKFHTLLGSYASRALRYGFFAGKAAASLETEKTQQIGRRMMAALEQEANKLICDGIARNAQDIDAIMVKNHGFAREAGGPLFWLREHKNDGE